MSQPTTKRCARCLETKALDEFGFNERMKLGRKSYCHDCSAELQVQWRKNKEEAERSRSSRAGRAGRSAKKKTTRKSRRPKSGSGVLG